MRARGIDLSSEMVAIACERPGDSADVLVADAENLPLLGCSADLMTCVDSFHHCPDPCAALVEMHRVTREGWSHWATLRVFRRTIDAAGDYSRTLAPRLRGKYRVKAVLPGWQDWVGVRTDWQHSRVRRP